jgi:hypothetical protein
MFFRVAMDFIEHMRVGKERAAAGFGAEQDRPPAISRAWIICRVGIAEDPSAEGNEAILLLLRVKTNGHNAIPSAELPR